MAHLTAPHRALAFKKPGKGRNVTKTYVPRSGKYHLVKHDGDPTDPAFKGGFTVCNLIIWDDGAFGKSAADMYSFEEIDGIPAERLCAKCTAAFHVKD